MAKRVVEACEDLRSAGTSLAVALRFRRGTIHPYSRTIRPPQAATSRALPARVMHALEELRPGGRGIQNLLSGTGGSTLASRVRGLVRGLRGRGGSRETRQSRVWIDSPVPPAC